MEWIRDDSSHWNIQLLAVKTLAKSPTFARDPRHLQFEADINLLFLSTSYYRLGSNAEEKDAEEIIEMASKASVADQQQQVHENIHSQIKSMCETMDAILLPDKRSDPTSSDGNSRISSRRSGLSFAMGRRKPVENKPVIPPTQPLSRLELSKSFRDTTGYTLEVRKSEIAHKDAGDGLFLSGEANVGAVVAFYPGVIYSPAYYQYIPGYPRIDSSNTYLITRYDGVVINARPWGPGGETRELWDGSCEPGCTASSSQDVDSPSDRMWRMLCKPLERGQIRSFGDNILELRNPLAFGHYANHPPKGISPNVMICPYDFPLSDKDMRVYVPNIAFGDEDSVTMRRFGTFWFKSAKFRAQEDNSPVLKTLVLVATRNLCDEEIFLNYRLSNSKRCPEWYTPVDEEEDRRRWS